MRARPQRAKDEETPDRSRGRREGAADAAVSGDLSQLSCGHNTSLALGFYKMPQSLNSPFFCLLFLIYFFCSSHMSRFPTTQI